ncbi:MAG TPA: TonB-dependent receptor [Bacteroidales bacterium]|nr:TonB-dependent receptor [Bacteroidales bacterium]
MNRLLCLCLILITVLSKAQQNDTVYSLPQIEVVGGRIAALTTGSYFQTIDTIALQQSATLADILASHTTAVIRSSGPGSSALLSTRGMQSTQSVVSWEGIALNSPTHGSTDLSMMPVFVFDNISMQYGGGSALTGSGAMGGNLLLSASDNYNQPLRFRVKLAAGSFSNYAPSLKMASGSDKLSYSFAIAANRSQNNFGYTDLSGKKAFLRNAGYKSLNVVQKVGWKIKPHHLLSLSGWWQASNRDIPPSMVMFQSTQHQDDKALRLALQYKWLGVKSLFSSGIAFTHEYMRYTDELSQTDAVYNNNTCSSNIGYKNELSASTSIDAGINAKLIIADVPYYESVKKQPELATYFSLIQKIPGIGWNAAINLRHEFVEGYKVPFCPSFGAEGRIKGKLGGRINLSRNFRVPALNDRYWQPGGNPDLIPESSYNAEAGISIKIGDSSADKIWEELVIQAYSAWVDDLILWVPANASFWSPQNIEKLWSRGVEVISLMKLQKSKYSSTLTLQYIWSPSTLSGHADNADKISGKQLIYIPLHTVKGDFRLRAGRYLFLLNGVGESRRYTRKDNGEWLPAHGILNLSAGRDFILHGSKLTFRLDITNILNSSYQSVQFYPAPGITFLGSLTAEI